MAQGQNGKPTLCWWCQNAVPSAERGHGCSWSRAAQPVPGWTAERRDVLMQGAGKRNARRVVESYLVTACPLFQRDGPAKITTDKKGGKGVRTRSWDTARAQVLRDEGRSMREIADMVGASEVAVRGYFQRLRKDDQRLQQKLDAARGAEVEQGNKDIAPYICLDAATTAPPVPVVQAMGVHEAAELLYAIDQIYPGARLECRATDGCFYGIDVSVRPLDGLDMLDVTVRLK